MAIADEVRQLARRRSFTAEELLDIADRIDAEHKREISRAAQLLADAEETRDLNYANWQDCKQKVLQHNITIDELYAEIEGLKDEMAERDWYRVVDADKQTIRFNDDVEWELLSSGETEHGYVVGIKIDLIADRQSCRVKVVRDSDFQTIELMAENLHHVKPDEPEPTVEDVLRDMHAKLDEVTALYVGEAIDSDERDSDEARIFAEYAAKLREMLAGDAE